MAKRTFWIPDYYARFVCKADRCRANCCHGWTITISMQDYFNLLGVPCSPTLRRKLDTALHPVKNPTPERYAQILPDWEGNCPLQQANGLCGLQCECGAEMLSSTCRYYPRGIRTAFANECCCSSSCEGVLETMFEQKEPIRMTQKELSFDMALPEAEEQGVTADEDRSIQRAWVLILQDRAYSLPERMQRLGCAARALHHAQGGTAAQMMQEALERFAPVHEDEALSREAFLVAVDMLEQLVEHSMSLAPYMLQAKGCVLPRAGEDAGSYERYCALRGRLDTALPDWQIDFEHMLVNHILYQGYPYSQRHESVWDEYMALCALYALLRLLSVACVTGGGDFQKFVDICAAAFKVFEHSAFDHNAMVILRQNGMTEGTAMRRLTSL